VESGFGDWNGPASDVALFRCGLALCGRSVMTCVSADAGDAVERFHGEHA
jgi:hypothetical protein